jgi:hypothetical protein
MFKDLLKNKDKKLNAEQKKMFDYYRQSHVDDMMLATYKEDSKNGEISQKETEV